MRGQTAALHRQACSAGTSPQKLSAEKIYSDNVGIVQYVLSKFRFPAQLDEDLTQEVFLRYFESSKQAEHVNPRSFLIRVARNIAIDQYRTLKKHATDCRLNFEDLGAFDSLWLNDPQRAQERLAVESFMREIRQDPAAKTLVMFYDEDLDIKEIADRSQESIGTVTSRLSRLRKKYRDKLQFHMDASLDCGGFA